jgi:hypothetical protein
MGIATETQRGKGRGGKIISSSDFPLRSPRLCGDEFLQCLQIEGGMIKKLS